VVQIKAGINRTSGGGAWIWPPGRSSNNNNEKVAKASLAHVVKGLSVTGWAYCGWSRQGKPQVSEDPLDIVSFIAVDNPDAAQELKYEMNPVMHD